MIRNAKHIHISSADRISGTISHFSANVEIPSGFDSVVLNWASIYKSYNLVEDGYNTFVLDEGGSQAEITIPFGDYNSLSFPVVLKSLLDAGSPNGWTYTISYPDSGIEADTGLYTYSVSGNSGVQPKFIMDTDQIHMLMGFHPNSTNLFVSDSLTSTHKINFQLEDVLMLRSDICDDEGGDILETIISNDTSFMGSVVYQCSNVETHFRKLRNNRSTGFTFNLTDKYGSDINLHGLNWDFELVVFRRNEFLIHSGDFMYEILKYVEMNKKMMNDMFEQSVRQNEILEKMLAISETKTITPPQSIPPGETRIPASAGNPLDANKELDKILGITTQQQISQLPQQLPQQPLQIFDSEREPAGNDIELPSSFVSGDVEPIPTPPPPEPTPEPTPSDTSASAGEPIETPKTN